MTYFSYLKHFVDFLWPRKNPTVEEFNKSLQLPTSGKTDCRNCHYHYGQVDGGNFLICVPHPYGATEERCRDWEAKQP